VGVFERAVAQLLKSGNGGWPRNGNGHFRFDRRVVVGEVRVEEPNQFEKLQVGGVGSGGDKLSAHVHLDFLGSRNHGDGMRMPSNGRAAFEEHRLGRTIEQPGAGHSRESSANDADARQTFPEESRRLLGKRSIDEGGTALFEEFSAADRLDSSLHASATERGAMIRRRPMAGNSRIKTSKANWPELHPADWLRRKSSLIALILPDMSTRPTIFGITIAARNRSRNWYNSSRCRNDPARMAPR
jgi:hypothetical protein